MFIFGTVVPTLAMGTTRHVYESEGAQGIQDSINVSGASDTVFVHTGTYYVRDVDSVGITMKDSVRLISPHPDSVTLSGLNSTGTDTTYHVIYWNFGDSSSHAALIRRFTITDGNANGSTPHDRGGGIYCHNLSPMIDSCTITNNSARNAGGGIYLSCSSCEIINNTINSNVVNAAGAGLLIEASSPKIENNRIENNLSICGSRGGLWLGSYAEIRNNIIKNNSVPCIGGGFYICGDTPPKIENNLIENNKACCGGGAYLDGPPASAEFVNNTIVNNDALGHAGGAFCLYRASAKIDSCFIIDNWSQDTKSGIVEFYSYADMETLKITHSHLYYNTYQQDKEIHNLTGISIPLENNFWWDTTDAGILALIEGPNDHTPWEYDFIPGVPGEPVSIDSVRNYDSSYSFIVDSLENDPDTLYLRIYGQDRNAKFREAAVAIIKSSIYPTGIAVALVETDTNSGVYQGEAIIRVDDIYNIVKADTGGDVITITANMDTTQEFVVYYRCGPGVEEKSKIKLQNAKLELYPNPFTQKTVIKVQGLVEKERLV